MSGPVVAAADWGTTRLRLWLLDADGAVLAERRADDGLMSAARRGFANVLEDHLAALDAPAGLPVIVCGMAGARQGWREAPYVRLPANFGDVARGALRIDGLSRDVRIVPGLCCDEPTHPEVMRGEETQLLGLAVAFGRESALVCLPGTHSKWARCQGGRIVSFRSWMTGELFALLAGQSILAHSTAGAAVDPAGEAFAGGVRAALEDPAGMPGMLFAIRAGSLLHGLGPADAAARLSGLLVGAEIAAALGEAAQQEPVRLVAQGLLGALYGTALALAGRPVIAADADAAVRAGLFEAARLNDMILQKDETTA